MESLIAKLKKIIHSGKCNYIIIKDPINKKSINCLSNPQKYIYFKKCIYLNGSIVTFKLEDDEVIRR